MNDATHIILDDTAMAAAGRGHVLASRLIHRAHVETGSLGSPWSRLRLTLRNLLYRGLFAGLPDMTVGSAVGLHALPHGLVGIVRQWGGFLGNVPATCARAEADSGRAQDGMPVLVTQVLQARQNRLPHAGAQSGFLRGGPVFRLDVVEQPHGVVTADPVERDAVLVIGVESVTGKVEHEAGTRERETVAVIQASSQRASAVARSPNRP